ncbi:MAG TPA: RNA polymerase subunit sigma-70 [Ruminococcus sp.]|nr:RNA polymerase subunit sigma-70 [Ruminococcus sp.]
MSSDKHLVWRIKRGSRKAADELFGRYYKEIYAYIYKQCGDKELAMDLTQDTFVAAFRGLQGYDDKKAEFRTWLYRIASNKIADYYRSKQYHQRVTEQSLDEMVIELSDDSDILESLAEKELIRHIMDIVSGYELVWVHIFQMKIFEEMTFNQIGDELGLSENTVKTRYYAMIKHIRKELSE